VKLNISVFFQSPVNIFIFRHVSPRVSRRYLQAIGFLYYLVNRKEKRRIAQNVRDLLEGRAEPELRKVTRETFRGIFSHYFEKMCSAFMETEAIESHVRRHVRIEGGHLLDKALQKGKGCILVTAHWGGVELIPWVLTVARWPASIILECKTARLAKAFKRHESLVGTELIIGEHGGSILARALQSLKSNRVLMTQCDEVETWHKRRTSTIRLFGRSLYFDNTIEIIAKRTGAAVVGAFLERSRDGTYVLRIEDVSVERTPASTGRECLGLWEKYVTMAPEQWYQWKHWDEMKAPLEVVEPVRLPEAVPMPSAEYVPAAAAAFVPLEPFPEAAAVSVA
jgi:Kdo2-lipid IVA lauroyltransferase/acyltransferase